VLTADLAVADYFEQAAAAEVLEGAERVDPKMLAHWVSGELFGLLNQAGLSIEASPVAAQNLANLMGMVAGGAINQNTAKVVLAEMFATGKPAPAGRRAWLAPNLDPHPSPGWSKVLAENPEQVAVTWQVTKVGRWLFGEVMRSAKGQANPQVVQQELEKQIMALQ
jgi:aspartyl-tRNA(Asn)/glutamyl-tRNA(Gln) amidotransferase subunit B